jgi:hypothetical protein
VITGVRLMQRSAGGLMDHAISAHELAAVHDVLVRHQSSEVRFHGPARGRPRRSFVSFHVLVPGSWTVQRAHELATLGGNVTVFTHLEPIQDPASFEHVGLDRESPSRGDK